MSDPVTRSASKRRRGQPVVALALLLGGWVAMRAATWQELALPARADASRPSMPKSMTAPAPGPASIVSHSPPVQAPALPAAATPFTPQPATATPLAAPPLLAPPPPVQVAPSPAPVALPDSAPAPVPVAAAPPAASRLGGATAHALLWMAAVSTLPLPGPFAAPAGQPAPPLPPRGPMPSRWSVDGWLLARRDGGATTLGPLPTYGASQLGAVARYRLGDGGMRPAAYLRATAALNGSGERGLALGFSARPLRGVPVRLMAEARADRFAGGSGHLRAAVLAVTEAPPVALPGGVRAEFYAQAGYVTAPAATGFVDGQLRLDKALLGQPGKGQLRAGVGAWGGAQQGAGRLDLGPTASVSLARGSAAARLSADWRFRVAGQAAPSSGPALTISAGF